MTDRVTMKPSSHTRPGLVRRLAAIAVALCLTVTGLTVVDGLSAPAANALSGSSFNPGFIISDATFFNGTALTAAQAQTFLSSRGSSCTGSASVPCLKNYSQATPTRAATSYCQTYAGASSETAAQIVTHVGAVCGINPQVLLVMLEKEQGLVTTSSPTSYMYRSALGFGCPDTAACDSTYYGFFNQVYAAAAQFQSYTKNSTSWSYQPGRNNNILYNPSTSCGSSSVFIQNQATANLYIYTPYQPNAAALANLYGSGDACSAYGNRNFWVLFNTWFGDPTGGGLMNASFEGSFAGWVQQNGPANWQNINNPSLAEDGSWLFATNTTVAGRSNSQDVQRTVNVGDQVTATIWLRSSGTAPFSGAVAAWALGGGPNETASTAYTVTGAWQKITVKLPIRQSSHPVIRLEVYMYSTTGTLLMDNAALAYGQAPPLKNLLSSPGFEGQLGGWAPGNGDLNRAVFQDSTIAHSGSWFGASNTQVANRSLAQTIPVQATVGDRYSFSIWVKLSNPKESFSGTLALWALGGSPYNNSTSFTAGATWSKVTVSTDITSSAVSLLKPEIYIGTTKVTVLFDDGSLSRNLLTAGSFEGGSLLNWGVGNGTINQATFTQQQTGIPPQNGTWFGATNTTAKGGSFAQTITRDTIAGDTYTAEMWVRSADPNKTFKGTLALWGLGGTTDVGTVDFTAGSGWTRVAVDVTMSHPDHTSLKFEIYENSTDDTLLVDGAQVY
ncbi:carbohydrate binding domain-containing protein [Subtercola endophyticus]|uniref:carbohydrate binding domain-containing protein n=1 Tax=Subtercola endophyticus TaxID=2895559 RepID=UPI001E4AD7BE|nr:carbohydrate binding domain-containing protein [Subtercola endophyticus]UFS57753.1 carbohydrate binding domain-containing protein [Subtercola endophyticus]